jgi:hypothetical protein
VPLTTSIVQKIYSLNRVFRIRLRSAVHLHALFFEEGAEPAQSSITGFTPVLHPDLKLRVVRLVIDAIAIELRWLNSRQVRSGREVA